MSGSAPQGPIDVHVHAIPPAIVKRAREGRFPGVEASSDDGRLVVAFPSARPTPPASPALADFDTLAGLAADRGITTQLIGPWTDLFGITLPSDEAGGWCRSYNEALADECSRRTGMLPMAMVPLQSPALAVRELEAAKAAGCPGAVIGTGLPSGRLDRGELDDFWAAAADLRMILLMHPTFVEVATDLRDYGLKNAVGRAGETAIALARLVYSGVLTRHPRLRLIAAHGGGGFVPLIPRLVRNSELGWASSDEDVRACIARLFWDSVVLDPDYLAYLVDAVGEGRVLLGSDHPFPWEPDPVGIVRRAGLERSTEAGILESNARELLEDA